MRKIMVCVKSALTQEFDFSLNPHIHNIIVLENNRHIHSYIIKNNQFVNPIHKNKLLLDVR